MFRVLVFVILTLNFNAQAAEYIPVPIPEVEMECGQESQPLEWSYCIHKKRGSRSQDVLYYMHARNGNPTWWNDKDYHTGKLYEEWEQQKVDAPTVVSISFGKLWLLTENEFEFMGGRHNIFLDSIVPLVESKLNQKIDRRLIAGISMGGLNTLIQSLKVKNFYQKAAAICTPLAAVSPHDGFLNVAKYFFSSSTSLKRALMLWKFSKEFYPTQEVWKANDPIAQSKSFKVNGAPDFYSTCGKKDDWGCMKGSELLVENLRAKGASVEWVPRPGGHCDIDYMSLARFLSSQ